AQTVEGALAEQGLAAHRGGERERGDQAPQDDADDDADDVNQVHWSPPPRAAIARAAVRAIRPAMIGSGSAIKMRQPTNSGPKNGSSQTRARLEPSRFQAVMKATAVPTSAPSSRKAPATG